jgi:type II secretory pathway pseudopilin PulG
LTVVFIISLLIGLLIPGINGARNAAKKATTAKTLSAIQVGLEMFKGDNEAEFRQTNGYPPSFAYPPIPGFTFQPHLGQFPFSKQAGESGPPRVYGAHWLPAMLIGADAQGYIKRSSVPQKDNLRQEPWRWYTPDPLDTGRSIERQPFYMDPDTLKTTPTNRLPGRENRELFPNWSDDDPEGMQTLPVIVDSFGQPVLYYVAQAHGKPTNLVADLHRERHDYDAGPQEEGIPFYFHQDNIGFTGSTELGMSGWVFGDRDRDHPIADSGAKLTAVDLREPENRNTFARYILDRKVYKTSVEQDPTVNTPLRPVNADTYLLITAGPDGYFGTGDDVTNMPPWED